MKLLTHERQWRGGDTAVAFGMFDGVHLGHARLMQKAVQLARRDGLESVVYTFSTHPTATFAPERVPLQLNTRSEKIREIARQGIDVALLRPFDRDYAAQSPEAFVQAFCRALHPRHVVIGFNYTFGCKGAGKAEDIIALGKRYGFETHVVDEVQLLGEPLSSTRVRAAVAQGDMQLVHALLGRPYTLSGVVQRGKQLGRTLDFPTANLSWSADKAIPPSSVYAALADVGGRRYMAAVNIGSHPTAPGGGYTVEANLLDYDGGECYGSHMRLSFYARLREERQFESLDALRDEVMRNRSQTRALFAGMTVKKPEIF